MKIASSIALATLLMAGPAYAQTTTAPKAGTKMSQSDCTAAWTKLDTAKSGSVSQTQAQGVVTDFKTADANHDGKLTSAEFMSACDKGRDGFGWHGQRRPRNDRLRQAGKEVVAEKRAPRRSQGRAGRAWFDAGGVGARPC